MTDDMKVKAQALLDAAHAYWGACYEANSPGAIRWLRDTNDRLLVFTRGEYIDQIMNNIWDIKEKEHIEVFEGAELELEEDEE